MTATKHKRKRSENDVSQTLVARVAKRAVTPASRPSSALFSNVSVFSPFSARLPSSDASADRPVASQDNVLITNPRLPDLRPLDEYAHLKNLQHTSPRPGPDPFGPTGVELSTEVSNHKRSRPYFGRARSNDIFSSQPRPLTPPQVPVCVRDATMSPHDRIPTPITARFNANLPYVSPFPHHASAAIHTNLSPMMEQETWGSLMNATHRYSSTTCTQDSLPSLTVNGDELVSTLQTSPTVVGTSLDNDTRMILDDATTASLSSLHVSGEDDTLEADSQCASHGMDTIDGVLGLEQDHQMQSSQAHLPAQKPYNHSRNASSLSSNGRMTRLHMGFLAGCDKCAQQVPGHYSHILRSGRELR